MPLPSDSRHTTLRSGHATAAPTASGSPVPIAPPGFVSQSCGAEFLRRGQQAATRGDRLVDDDRLLGQQRGDDGRQRRQRDRPARQRRSDSGSRTGS